MTARDFCTAVNVLRTSSRNTIPSIFSKLALAKKIRDVMIVRMRHCATADAIASRPPVKFKLTGALPLRSTAMLAIAPPTDAGRRMPTIESSAQCFLSQCDSSMLPTRVLP